jgi:RHH-type transcriptional regulator, proline utilization regulon repressor / proline dehydrogenase / delta 1-pyrroline-5-carboxylate dehydrogenase
MAPRSLRDINLAYLGDETSLVRRAADRARLPRQQAERVRTTALSLVEGVRGARRNQSGLDSFLQQYDLSSKEGVLLLCLAEALLRIPDDDTADRLIAEKIRAGDWSSHAGSSESLFVNASTWSLMLTGRVVLPVQAPHANTATIVERLVARLSEPVVRAALRQAMRILATQFVMGQDIGAAIARAHAAPAGVRHSFDMLGEGALTAVDAQRHFDAYCAAIDAVGAANAHTVVQDRASVSVKLSALHPRYEPAQRDRVLSELMQQVLLLAQRAAAAGVPMTLDAEESERLELSLQIVSAVMESQSLAGWDGFGLAVQAYQRRSAEVVDWLVSVSRQCGRRLNLRLVKGAYWDSEVKRAQERGLATYPVFTRKVNSDVSYLACARQLFTADAALIYPQFATHNAHTVAYVLGLAMEYPRAFEFQRLHGMGEELYDSLSGMGQSTHCRVYAPVGSHEELLPYLVRRLLENGANTSFVNRIVDERLPVDTIIGDPVAEVDALQVIPHALIPDPGALFGTGRRNSVGLNLADPLVIEHFEAVAAPAFAQHFHAQPVVPQRRIDRSGTTRRNPARRDDVVGTVVDATTDDARAALACVAAGFAAWEATPASERAACLLRAADAMEANRAELMVLCVREAGKTLPAALAEVREAVDFLRYYAQCGEREFSVPQLLPGPTGERNELSLHGRGPFVCISPWNFPLAIFTGQVAAALVAGNTVIAKPAEQTPLIAARAVQLMHDAGIPVEALCLLPGDGALLGAALLSDVRVAGVAFTGSHAVAQLIQRQLAARDGALGVLIAETGGQNVMLVDSSALPDQVVFDAVTSAFDSAGQRCSALRVLLVQDDIADRVVTLLRGYMDELVVSDPALLATDIGPVIDAEARARLEAHLTRVGPQARWVHRTPMDGQLATRGYYFAPVALEIESLDLLQGEVFGPVLHVMRYGSQDFERIIEDVNSLGFGLTMGIQTRIESTARHVAARARVGNVYVNRNIIGAVVGVQPFGGCGLSGTGPKAGGPHYLQRFATEKTVTTNTAAIGGNANLLSLGDP